MYAWMNTSTFCPPVVVSDTRLPVRRHSTLIAVIFRLGARKHMYLCNANDAVDYGNDDEKELG